MLARLSIRDVVLIDRLDLEFGHGLSVLTGETGAGKSILLDALGLALGRRAETRLVRQGCDQASVTAEFDIAPDSPVWAKLEEHAIALDGNELLLRRVLGSDGRSRAFINDQSISVGLLGEIGSEIVEIHGQFDNQKLMSPSSHMGLLDALGGHEKLLLDAGAAFNKWREANAELKRATEAWEAAKRDEEYLTHAVDELNAISPEPGEESRLAKERALMMHGEK
ncbi:MAG: AAA family ATPase, partial [Rhodospirillaceae bacterium]|nr:AAA family ATPase [Rhodospirillaceae bacterium]